MFGRSMRTRGRRMEECLTAMRHAWTGEPFEFEGRPVRVTPIPATPGGPPLLMGGGSAAAARRAGRFGIGFLAQSGDRSLERTYREACSAAGHPPGLCIVPPPDSVMSAFVAEDPDRAWSQLGPHLLHDARSYAAWMGEAASASKSVASSVEELRAEGGTYRIFTPDEAIAYVRERGILLLQPLCGGIPPALAWKSLELLAGRVLPALRNDAPSSADL